MVVCISACGNSPTQNDNADNIDKDADEESNVDGDLNKNNDQGNDDADEDNEEVEGKGSLHNSDNETAKNDDNSGITDDNSNKDNNSRNSNDGKKNDVLAKYSPEEIEYARIWLQLGDTQNIDKLNVQHISSGTPLNPDDKTSLDYPEDVVQLTGSRLAEGSITYSSNGDGTIKLYSKIPQRWDGKNPAGEDTYKDIIEDTKQKSIDTGDDEKVKELIKKLNVDS